MAMKKTRVALAVAHACGVLAVGFAASVATTPVVFAQSAVGSVYGFTKSGAEVSLSNPATGLNRSVKADSSGAFNFSKLAPGEYTVTSGGAARAVSVVAGTGAQVDFGAERIEVTGGRAKAIDTRSVESTTVFTAKQMEQLPVMRDPTAVALLAPSVVRGDADLGDKGSLPSIGGASVAENAYFINGFDVTNLRFMTSYANLPFDAIAQQQVKTGGYGAEYGRSLGGVVSLVTKRGTNDWKGGGSVYWEPKALRQKGKNVLDKDPDNIAAGNIYYSFRSENERSDMSYDAWVSGPIIKDKLFMFAVVEGRNDTKDIFDQSSSYHYKDTRPNAMVKLDFQPSDKHAFELTYIDTKVKRDYIDYTSATDYANTHDGAGRKSTLENGGYAAIAKYTGYITDNFTVSATVGKVFHEYDKWTGPRGNNPCPAVYGVGFVYEGCWEENAFGIMQPDPTSPFKDKDTRDGTRLDLEYSLGTHTLRGGLDLQKYTASSPDGTYFPGGVYYTYYRAGAAGATVVNGAAKFIAAPGEEYVRKRIASVTGGSYDVMNNAFYIEDNWQFTKDILLYGGLRSESFDNKTGTGESFIKKDNLIAPRLGFAWDLKSDASLKVYGTAGRYYIPVSADMNIREARAEYTTYDFYHYTGKDPVTAAPTGLSAPLVSQRVVSDGKLKPGATYAASNLNPMSQDEFILGFQQALVKNWTAGVKAIYRKVNNGMDDTCNTDAATEWAITRWAADNGHANFDKGDNSQCVLINPGKDMQVSVALDHKNPTVLTSVTIPATYWDLPTYKRTYQALEFSLEKQFDGQWGGQFSYTWSKSKGNSEGYVISGLNQEDPGLTQDWDMPSFLHGAEGYLPNDRRHQFKAFGTFALNDEVRFGANLTVTSGRAYSCLGYPPPNVATEVWPSVSSYYCHVDAKSPSAVIPRGTMGRTPWTQQLDLQANYTPKWAGKKAQFQVDVFNVFNSQKASEYDEQRDFSLAESTSASGPWRLNANYLNPTSFQTPRSVRLTARYEF